VPAVGAVARNCAIWIVSVMALIGLGNSEPER
jgi:hypothetical protein